ncbi:MAG: N-acetylmuramoyl-L-alanine amidase [Gemmatimonadetes bacterium]|nr:N-acetylmuramoyl-L-alanine amidase [Gemmatimonadota bacterium]
MNAIHRRPGLEATIAVCAAAFFAAGCASTGGQPSAVPAGVMQSTLPPIPPVSGPLDLYVEYPDSLQRIAVSDTNFIHGRTGAGDATLIIDGQFVDVEPNGTFLAWLPVPRAAAGDTAYYQLIARRAGEVDTLSHPILLPPAPFEGEPGTPWIDSASVVIPLERWALPDEELVFSFRGAPGMQAWLAARSGTVPMLESPVPGRYVVRIPAAELHTAACTADACDWLGETVPLATTFFLSDGTVEGRHDLEVPLRLLDPAALPIVELVELPDSISGTNGVVIGRPSPFGPYRWRFPVGTRAEVDGRDGDRVRIRLAPDLNTWLSEEDTRPAAANAAPPRSLVGDLRFQVRADRIELRIPLSAALPLQVDEPDGRTVELTLFGATGHTDRVAQGAGSRAVQDVRWAQLPGDRYRLTVTLSEPVWGYRTTYRSLDGDRAELVLEIRRMPAIDPLNPLAGRKVVIDPGHPGAGATGPSGYYEGHANLGIGLALERQLAESGALPVLIRRDTLPMGLYERTTAAIEAGGELYVSIHNNALPDGVRPFGREGTSTYYYHPHSRHLATTVQEGMLDSMRLRDLGVYWGNLAVCRMAWMPSILTEGAFMMMPDHEAALKDPEFQARYARGVLEGIRAFLAESLRASGAPPYAGAP